MTIRLLVCGDPVHEYSGFGIEHFVFELSLARVENNILHIALAIFCKSSRLRVRHTLRTFEGRFGIPERGTKTKPQDQVPASDYRPISG